MSGPRRGFALGKFMPPHQGHLFLLEAARRMVDEMTVLVCSFEAEPIPGALRHDWMRALLPGLNVRHMHREIPQNPDEHPDFWPIWRAAIAEFHPQRIDCVFAAERYVFRLAAELGAKPVLIDPDREIFAVSGGDIRADPSAHWNFIPPIVRPYFQQRVCLLGPESSGKSRLAETLARRFAGPHMPEYGRAYDAAHRGGEGWRAADLVALATTHRAMRDALSPFAGPVLIEDTDAIQTAVWAEYLLGETPADLEALIAGEAPAELYLLLTPEVAWRDDGTRYCGTEEVRTWFFERCRDRLRALGRRFEVVGGTDWNARAEAARELVEALLRAG